MNRYQSSVGVDGLDHGESTNTYSDVLTRRQAAMLLGISQRQLDRLHIPKSYAAGPRSPRYLREDIIAFLKGAMVAPITVQNTVGSNSTPVVGRRKTSAGGDWLRARLAALK